MDQLPGAITVPTRDTSRARYIRDRLLRTPNARADRGSQIWVDANTHADTINPIYALAVKAGQNVGLDGLSGTDLEQAAIDQGLPGRLPPVGGSGFVICQGSSSGGTIFVGDRIKDPVSGLSFQCTATKLYKPLENIPITGIDTGPQTDLPAGTVLQWQTQRPGIGANAAVFQQQDGGGLEGGSDEETDDGIRARIREARANPPASGNDAQYQAAVEATPGIPVEKCFTVPAILGPGSMGYTFTVRAPSLGGSRIPNATQIAQTLAYVAAQMPANDSIFDEVLIPDLISVYLQVAWSPTATGWADAVPWPLAPSLSSPPVHVTADATPTASTFVLDCSGVPLIGGSQPVPGPGMRIAFYDGVNLVADPVTGILSPTFRLKTILTATSIGGGKYSIVCDLSNQNSDPVNVPLVGQPCCPWSASLNSLIAPVLGHTGSLGPGESTSSANQFDNGLRLRRQPRSPQFWPSELTHRLLQPLFPLNTIQDVSVVGPALPLQTPAGTPGVSAYLMQLQYLAAYAE